MDPELFFYMKLDFATALKSLVGKASENNAESLRSLIEGFESTDSLSRLAELFDGGTFGDVPTSLKEKLAERLKCVAVRE